jgi:hypothetical protein
MLARELGNFACASVHPPLGRTITAWRGKSECRKIAFRARENRYWRRFAYRTTRKLQPRCACCESPISADFLPTSRDPNLSSCRTELACGITNSPP